MDSILSPDQLRAIYDQSVRIVTEQASGIRLRLADTPLHGDICTLYTNFERNADSGLAMCAETKLFIRLTQRMKQTSEPVDFQEVALFAKEYFNILCGHIAVALFHHAKVATRFQTPAFYHGWYQPNQRESMNLQFLSDAEETVHLIHYKKAYTADREERQYQKSLL